MRRRWASSWTRSRCSDVAARGGANAKAAAARLRADGNVAPAVLDVTDAHTIQLLARELASRGVRVDIVVNNAAVLVGESRGVLETTDDDLRATFETNVFGA